MSFGRSKTDWGMLPAKDFMLLMQSECSQLHTISPIWQFALPPVAKHETPIRCCLNIRRTVWLGLCGGKIDLAAECAFFSPAPCVRSLCPQDRNRSNIHRNVPVDGLASKYDRAAMQLLTSPKLGVATTADARHSTARPTCCPPRILILN